MASKAQKLKNHEAVVVRVSKRAQVWHGFNMAAGHLFGEDAKGYFVSGGRPGNRTGSVIVYRCQKLKPGQNYFRWYKTVDFISYGTGAAIWEAAHTYAPGVTYPPVNGDYSGSKPFFPTFRDKRPKTANGLPRERVHKTYLDQMTKAAQTTKPCVNWKPAVAWKEA